MVLQQREEEGSKMEDSLEPLRLSLVQHYRQDYNCPYFNGIYVKDLKERDVVSFEGIVGSHIRVVVILMVTYPKQSGVEVVRVVRLGGLSVEIPLKDLGLDDNSGIRGHFVVRGEVEGESVLGWIGVGADVRLTPNLKFELVKRIHLNGNSIFSVYSGSRYPYF